MIKLKEVLQRQINEAPEQHEVYEAIQKIVAGVDEAEYGINDLNKINFESKDKSQAKRIVNDFKVFKKRVDTFYSDVDKGKIKTSEF
jgi:hypothetical protein